MAYVNIFLLKTMNNMTSSGIKPCCRKSIYPPTKPFWFVFLLLGTFLIQNQGVAQTSIIAFKYRNGVVMGADSRVTIGKTNPIVGSKCKIIQIGGSKLFYAAAGTVSDPEIAYNISTIIDSADNTTRNISKKIFNFDEIIKKELITKLGYLKEKDIDAYRKEILDTNFVEIVFAGIEKNIPKFWVRSYRDTAFSKNEVKIFSYKYDCPGDCDSGFGYAAIGHHIKIDSIIATEGSGYWKRIGVVQAIINLITNEATAYPDHVGGRIDMINISNESIYWINENSKCQQIIK